MQNNTLFKGSVIATLLILLGIGVTIIFQTQRGEKSTLTFLFNFLNIDAPASKDVYRDLLASEKLVPAFTASRNGDHTKAYEAFNLAANEALSQEQKEVLQLLAGGQLIKVDPNQATEYYKKLIDDTQASRFNRGYAFIRMWQYSSISNDEEALAKIANIKRSDFSTRNEFLYAVASEGVKLYPHASLLARKAFYEVVRTNGKMKPDQAAKLLASYRPEIKASIDIFKQAEGTRHLVWMAYTDYARFLSSVHKLGASTKEETVAAYEAGIRMTYIEENKNARDMAVLDYANFLFLNKYPELDTVLKYYSTEKPGDVFLKYASQEINRKKFKVFEYIQSKSDISSVMSL
jgi:hypothetical protein